MEDYSSMSYFALKAECKKKNLDSKGKKVELLKRLGINQDIDTPSEPEIKVPLPDHKPTVILPAAEEDLKKYLPEVTFKPVIDVSRYKPWLTEQRLQTLKTRLDPIFAGKGSFNFQLDYDKGAFGVEFNGGASGAEYCTIIIEDNFIVRKAHEYCSRRLAIGRDGQVTAMKV